MRLCCINGQDLPQSVRFFLQLFDVICITVCSFKQHARTFKAEEISCSCYDGGIVLHRQNSGARALAGQIALVVPT